MSLPSIVFPSTHPSILNGLRERDRESWARFYLRYEPHIQRWCQRLRLSPDQCEELAQTIVVDMPCKIRAYQFMRDGGGRNRFRNWLKVVVRNRVFDFFRERDRRSADYATGDVDFDTWLADEVNTLEHDLLRANTRDVLEVRTRVQARVQPDTWTAFELVRIEYHAPKDVARMLSKSVVSIYTALTRVQTTWDEEYDHLLHERAVMSDEDSQHGAVPRSPNTSAAH